VITKENAPEKSHLVDTVSLLRVLRANSESCATLNIKYLSSAMSTHVLLSKIEIENTVFLNSSIIHLLIIRPNNHGSSVDIETSV
jgi:hypothetical protein